MKILNFLLDRIKEPSTWVGIGIAASAVAAALNAHQPLYAAVLAGIAAAFLPEKSK